MPYAGLTERTLRCRSGVFERKVWSLAPPAGRATAAILFLDGELYLERVGAAAVVRRLQERRAIPPAVAGVPERWYTTVDEALAGPPDVTSLAQVDNRGGCPLRDDAVLDGEKVSTVADDGVVRLRGTIPAVLCSWFDERVVDVEVAHAPDAAGYAELVAGSHAVDQPGNEQTEQDVVVDGRTVRVVRIVYPTNPTAGTSLTAALLDEDSRGRVRIEVHRTHEIDGYDEQAVARDLLAFLDS